MREVLVAAVAGGLVYLGWVSGTAEGMIFGGLAAICIVAAWLMED